MRRREVLYNQVVPKIRCWRFRPNHHRWNATLLQYLQPNPAKGSPAIIEHNQRAIADLSEYRDCLPEQGTPTRVCSQDPPGGLAPSSKCTARKISIKVDPLEGTKNMNLSGLERAHNQANLPPTHTSCFQTPRLMSDSIPSVSAMASAASILGVNHLHPLHHPDTPIPVQPSARLLLHPPRPEHDPRARRAPPPVSTLRCGSSPPPPSSAAGLARSSRKWRIPSHCGHTPWVSITDTPWR